MFNIIYRIRKLRKKIVYAKNRFNMLGHNVKKVFRKLVCRLLIRIKPENTRCKLTQLNVTNNSLWETEAI